MVQACHAPESWGQRELAAPNSVRHPASRRVGTTEEGGTQPRVTSPHRWERRTEPPSLAPEHWSYSLAVLGGPGIRMRVPRRHITD